MNTLRVYIGTFTHADGKVLSGGIHWGTFDTTSGKLEITGCTENVTNPAFLTLNANGNRLYAVNETSTFNGQPGGGVSAFAVDKTTGALTYLNSQPTMGESPCYVSLDLNEHWAMVSNYHGGSIATYPILADGSLGAPAEFIQHVGHGPNAERQEKAHAHSIRQDPRTGLVLVADLGLDRIVRYRLDERTGKLSPAELDFVQTHAGAGPRHFDFDPNRRWLYVLNELDATIEVRDGSANDAVIQTISTLPADFTGEKWGADIHEHPNGRFVYASNRGHDSIAAFAVDTQTGRLTTLGWTPTGGTTPRNFGISPDGRWLLAANQNGHNVVVFALDPSTGALTPAGEEVKIPIPVCTLIRRI